MGGDPENRCILHFVHPFSCSGEVYGDPNRFVVTADTMFTTLDYVDVFGLRSMSGATAVGTKRTFRLIFCRARPKGGVDGPLVTLWLWHVAWHQSGLVYTLRNGGAYVKSRTLHSFDTLCIIDGHLREGRQT